MQLRLETKQLNYSIDGFDILKGISINVEDRKMVGIIGP
ncbi:MAG TPA: ABC transporter, partial [Christensenellaceae bacterium]|nr:ABC transporter [Christensenellaceae bacterium]